MNFTTLHARVLTRSVVAVGLAVSAAFLAGCGQTPQPTEAGNLTPFKSAGPLRAEVALGNLAQTNGSVGPYRVVSGDVLELHMPVAALSADADAQKQMKPAPCLCRISRSGVITLPIIGDLAVAGKTLPEIESDVVKAYYPKYLVHRPSILVRLKDYRTAAVSISGAVNKPGIYELRSDEMSLMSLLMKAGGVVKEGASTIRVQSPNVDDLVLPLYGLNFPVADVVLNGGETVLVEQLDAQIFTVIGLVNKPGAYAYPPRAKYNLMQALAIAGGINDIAAPRYVQVYRQGADGEAVVGCFSITGKDATCASNIEIKPGDVVALEHTARTRTRVVLAEMLRLGAGVNLGASYRVGGRGY